MKRGWILLALCVLSPACQRAPETPLQRGRGIFLRSCASCHGGNGKGVMKPGFKVRPADLTNPELQALDDAELKSRILSGRGQMPAFKGLLSEQDQTDLVTYLRTLKP